MNIVIAGASGYIGSALIPVLLEKFPEAHITALSRSARVSDDERVTWNDCDLFSLKSLEVSLPTTIDLAVYLVHSMGPTARLDQGSFKDYDLILADNFSRALRGKETKQLIYLGGLAPKKNCALSEHMESRLEVESLFSYYKVPCTFMRAGVIVGFEGSSFKILLKLIGRLPVMVCPAWMQTLTSPVDLDSVLRQIAKVSLSPEHYDKTFDLAGCKPLSYLDMVKCTSEFLNKKRYFINVPYFSLKLSKLWVYWVSGAPKNLVYPLIESLKHDMVASEERALEKLPLHREYRELLKELPAQNAKEQSKRLPSKKQKNSVRSVQRIEMPWGKDSSWVQNEYINWLPKFLFPFLKVFKEKNRISLAFLVKKFTLLELEFSTDRSSHRRQLLYIRTGLLVSENYKGRLEFRSVLDGKYILVAIHNFRPALPWYIYRYTQAKLHLFVMRRFEKHLFKQSQTFKSKKNMKKREADGHSSN